MAIFKKILALALVLLFVNGAGAMEKTRAQQPSLSLQKLVLLLITMTSVAEAFSFQSLINDFSSYFFPDTSEEQYAILFSRMISGNLECFEKLDNDKKYLVTKNLCTVFNKLCDSAEDLCDTAEKECDSAREACDLAEHLCNIDTAEGLCDAAKTKCDATELKPKCNAAKKLCYTSVNICTMAQNILANKCFMSENTRLEEIFKRFNFDNLEDVVNLYIETNATEIGMKFKTCIQNLPSDYNRKQEKNCFDQFKQGQAIFDSRKESIKQELREREARKREAQDRQNKKYSQRRR